MHKSIDFFALFSLLAVHVFHHFPLSQGLYSKEAAARWKKLKQEKINVRAWQFHLLVDFIILLFDILQVTFCIV